MGEKSFSNPPPLLARSVTSAHSKINISAYVTWYRYTYDIYNLYIKYTVWHSGFQRNMFWAL